MDKWSKPPARMTEDSVGELVSLREEDSSSSKSPAQMNEEGRLHMRKADCTRSKSSDQQSLASIEKIIDLREADNISSVSSADSAISLSQAVHMRKADCTRSKSSDQQSLASIEKIIDLRKADNIRSKSSDQQSLASIEKIIDLREADNISSVSSADSAISLSHDAPPNFRTLEQRQSRHYAKPEDVACDLCEGKKLKACKSCMTCLASFCEIHIQDHYRNEPLQRHVLVEVTKSLGILQENAQLKKSIEALKKENETLKQKIGELRLPDYIRQEKIPAPVNVTLDQQTAHCALSLSGDNKRVRHAERSNVHHHNEQRFDKWECVLGSEGFNSGKLYWEVKVNREFTVGVIRQSAQRKGKFTFLPSEGYWCLYHFRQAFTALDDPSKNLPIDTVPQVLGVCADVDKKWVTFYNAETKAHIYTFRDMNTRGEKIYPLFSTLSKSMDLEIMTVRWDTLL